MFEYLAIYCPVLLLPTPRLRVSATEQKTSREQSAVLITARSCTDQQMLVLAAPHAPSVQWLMSKLTANSKINCKNPFNTNAVRVQIPRSGTLLANRTQVLMLTAPAARWGHSYANETSNLFRFKRWRASQGRI